MNDIGARIGDTVLVTWAGSSFQVEGTLRGIASAPGEVWIVHGYQGQIYCIPTFTCLRVLNRQAEEGHALL